MPSLTLTLCVVVYESVEVTQRFHQALTASLAGFEDVEVLYYDNSPSDTLARWFADRLGPSMQYTHDPRNLGFSYANNQLILRARHERILLLNPDVFGFSPTLWQSIASRPTAGTARFARLLNADGSFQDCVGELAGLGRALRPRRDFASVREPIEVGMGIMAFMLTEKSVFAEVGLLDCEYPLYAEDMDWCLRAKRAGVKVVYDPGIELIHVGAASASQRWGQAATLRRKYRAERIFIDKHTRGLEWLAMRLLNAAKLVLRAAPW
ncbi:MAG: glycosyltransferase family 2 protein [Armatimonadota bacterium]|nr:MAG: glycosyltransferase family 2 protein [Armatimonadota bacterium]